MKKICLTSLLVLFIAPALASADNTDPFADKKNAAEIIAAYEAEAKKIIGQASDATEEEKTKLNTQNNDNIAALSGNSTTTGNDTDGTPPEGEKAADPDATAADEKAAKAKKLADLKSKAEEAKETEQSLENKILGATGMATMGIGGMQLASGLAEKKADEEAETAMRAYLATFTCEYGSGRFAGGESAIELPGANALTPLVMQYRELANSLKTRKNALGMQPGIESEEIMDAATAGLYDDKNVGKTGGAYTSLARALSGDAEDAAAWNAQKEEAAKKVKTGAIVAGVGGAASLIGNVALNGELGEKIKDLKDKKASKKSEENAKDLKEKLKEAGMKNVDDLDLSKLDLSDTDDLIKKLDFKKLKSAIDKENSQIETNATEALDTTNAKKFEESLKDLFKSAKK
jgi:hypothetical protein